MRRPQVITGVQGDDVTAFLRTDIIAFAVIGNHRTDFVGAVFLSREHDFAVSGEFRVNPAVGIASVELDGYVAGVIIEGSRSRIFGGYTVDQAQIVTRILAVHAERS